MKSQANAMEFSASAACFICAWVFAFAHKNSPLPIGRKIKNFQFCLRYFSPQKKPQWSHTSPLHFQKRSHVQLCLNMSELLCPKHSKARDLNMSSYMVKIVLFEWVFIFIFSVETWDQFPFPPF